MAESGARPAASVARYADTEALIDAAAQYFVDVIVAAQAARGTASVVLTGGGTGIGMLEKVRQRPGGIDWSALDVYWGDERFVPTGDPERNEGQARAALLDHVPLNPARIHHMAAADGPYADAATAAVREELALVVAVTDSPKPPPVRVTLTLPAVRRSRHVCLIVAGAAKADAVARALAGADPVDIPAAGAVGMESTRWLLDHEAAARLT